jgi:hypothetical protein
MMQNEPGCGACLLLVREPPIVLNAALRWRCEAEEVQRVQTGARRENESRSVTSKWLGLVARHLNVGCPSYFQRQTNHARGLRSNSASTQMHGTHVQEDGRSGRMPSTKKEWTTSEAEEENFISEGKAESEAQTEVKRGVRWRRTIFLIICCKTQRSTDWLWVN